MSAPRPKPVAALPDPVTYTPYFARRHGQVHCEDVPLERIARHVGTPAYVYSGSSVRSAFCRLERALGALPHTICYSVKANSNRSLLRLLHRLGSGFDIVSGGELLRLRRAGVPTSTVVFSGVGKTREEIRLALRAGILVFNAESGAEMELIASEAARLRRRAPCGIRVNPDVKAGGHPHISTGHHQHKFGLDWSDALALYREHRASRWIAWKSLSAHIGSQILRVAPFARAIHRLAAYIRELRAIGVSPPYLDFGGGIGIRYADEQPMDLYQYARVLEKAIRPLGCHLLLEPGRVLVGPAGVLLMRVLYTKENRGRRFVIVDAAMNDFMRPTLYGALHPITPAAAARTRAGAMQRVDVVGPVCETGDCFVQDWPLGNVRSGDLLILWGAGAYGFVAASNYNTRLRPPEVLVEGSRFRVIRRRERFADVVRGE